MTTIIGYYGVRHSEPTHNNSPYKFCTFFFRNGCEWLGLDPFGEVVYSHQEEFCLPFPWGEGVNDVHYPNGKRPWRRHARQLFWLEVVEGTKFLAFCAVLQKFRAVALNGRPVITDRQDFGNHCSSAQMVSTCVS